jgi:hypothetical protein
MHMHQGRGDGDEDEDDAAAAAGGTPPPNAERGQRTCLLDWAGDTYRITAGAHHTPADVYRTLKVNEGEGGNGSRCLSQLIVMCPACSLCRQRLRCHPSTSCSSARGVGGWMSLQTNYYILKSFLIFIFCKTLSLQQGQVWDVRYSLQ